ncbi:MAG TPA: DUF4080 domain-containing protein [Kiritimatiellae bacterium]|nr:DUF4080 domain-containing protein [Kiritimatiellia bacterium]
MNVSRPVVLAAVNARYCHCSLAARYLAAGLEAHRIPFRLLEFTIHQSAEEIVRSIVDADPGAICLGVYVWNIALVGKVVRRLKETRAAAPIFLGGPEVSFETESQDICRIADATILGEGELLLPRLCQQSGGRHRRRGALKGPLPDLHTLPLPYDLYSEEDLLQRNVYVETTRGCPYRCAYCLSAASPVVRRFPLDRVLPAISRLLERGARRVKFVDRTFNSDLDRAYRILEFLLPRVKPPAQIHLEMAPDRFPRELLELAARFPPGTLRLEIGIQSWNEAALRAVNRAVHMEKMEENLRAILDGTGAEVHADLLAGLPGEDLASFADGFDRLFRIGPHEIQIGILKRLRGAPLTRKTCAWRMEFNPDPPYELRRSAWLSPRELEMLGHFSRVWDRVHNRGHFAFCMELFRKYSRNPFSDFHMLTLRVLRRFGRSHSLGLDHLAQELSAWLPKTTRVSVQEVRSALRRDYSRRRHPIPRWLRD